VCEVQLGEKLLEVKGGTLTRHFTKCVQESFCLISKVAVLNDLVRISAFCNSDLMYLSSISFGLSQNLNR
jgi:hypothetical protein